jgi:hypothetical protein
MRNTLYYLEDHFEALAEKHRNILTRSVALAASFVCASLGDALRTA